MSSRVLRSSVPRSDVVESLETSQKVSRTPAKKTPVAAQTPGIPTSPIHQLLTPPATNRKRKASQQVSEDASPQAQKKTPVKKQKKENEEKRERKFRASAPQSFQDIYNRAISQRFYVLNRTRCGTEACPEEEVEMTGSTGNIYTVHIGKQPRCTCPHNSRGGQQCKHILFVMSKVLHAPYNLTYQLALLSTELKSIFDAAPSISAVAEQGESDKRKPIEGDCPICYCELDGNKKESIVWCAAACGQNIHAECFKTWAKTKGAAHVTCPMCRSPWKGDDKLVASVQKNKGQMDEGYVNVADQLGVSRERDTSTYSRWLTYHQNGGQWPRGMHHR
ncbi:e3 ubiquitin- ligase zswim2 [Fusarium longipes]|uniref:E3 ubiquitin-ligase zswim2 n=1 Tax=Fusarium longipes TaxID=694270 RepID=A0A395RX33_9HYPO|nr:e3 ubiquitin- ligase zswim2 [Fusarium longipes]